MLEITLLEFFLRGLPEGFLIFFAVYVFSTTVINLKRYLLSSIILVISVYLIRLFPIQYGVHIILNLIVVIVLAVNINKISVIKAIQTSLITVLLEFICEGINMLIINYIFKVDITNILGNPSLKILYSIPSLLIFLTIVFACRYYMYRRKRLSGVRDGEAI